MSTGTNKDWQGILDLFNIRGKLRTTAPAGLTAYEKGGDLRLPATYRAFCEVFGPGTIGGWYQIAVPGYTGKHMQAYDLSSKTRFYHEGLEWDEYSTNPEQFKRAVIFGDDSTGSVYFWDIEEITIPKTHEYAVYAMFRDYSLERLCDTFWDFFNICIHKRRKKLYDEPPKMEFLAG